MSALNRMSQVVVYDDASTTNNPQQRVFDWRRSSLGVPVDNPSSQKIQVDPLTEVSVFAGTRTLGYNGSTQFALTLSPLDTTRYRLAWTGTGPTPAFRTDRALTLASGSVTIVVNAAQTITVTHSAGAVFGAVVVGDTVFIPGVSTGDTSLFDPMNEGEWTVLAATSTTLTLARPTGTTFSALAEVVALTTNAQLIAYSAAGVQVGDTLDIVAGFSASSRRSYKVVAVTSTWVEFTSTLPLAEETLIPGASSLQIYSLAKRWFYIETDQEIAIKLNGATDEGNRVEPLLAGDTPGWAEKWGTCYSFSVKNRSTARATIFIAFVE